MTVAEYLARLIADSRRWTGIPDHPGYVDPNLNVDPTIRHAVEGKTREVLFWTHPGGRITIMPVTQIGNFLAGQP